MGVINHNIPRRKPIRLTPYDYGSAGYYFVTICTRERGADILASITPSNDITVGAAICRPSPDNLRTPVQPSPVIALTPYGNIVEQSIHNISLRYPYITVDSYVIMPDHVHMLLAVEGSGVVGSPEVAEDGRQIAAPTAVIAAKIPTVIQQFKRAVSMTVGNSIWQKGYYDHIIRCDEDLQNIRQYILNNPLQWLLNQNQDVPVP